MDVSIIIRTKNESPYLGRTLQAIAEQNFKGSYEIIIVDSESTDATLDVAARHGVKLIQIRQEDFSYGFSLNLGAEHSEGDLLVNLSAHAPPATDKWLENLTVGFNNHEVAGVYGRQVSERRINPLEALQNDRFFGHKDLLFTKNCSEDVKNIHFSNSNCAIRKSVWKKFKFDECVPYAEDTIWQRQVMEAGFSVLYKANAPVYHTHKLTPQLAYRNSKRCAQTLALIDRESRTLSGILRDLGMFWGLIPVSTTQHLFYICRKRCPKYLALVPISVFAMLSGWLVGRVKYRLGKDPGPRGTSLKQ